MTPFHIENHNFKLSILELFFIIIFGYILYLIYFFYTNQIKANGKNNFTTFVCHNCSNLYNKWHVLSALIIFIKGYSCSKCKKKGKPLEIFLAIIFIPLVILNFIFFNKIDFLFFSLFQIFLFSIAQIDFEMMVLNIKSIIAIIMLGLIYKISKHNFDILILKEMVLSFIVGWFLVYSISYLYKIFRGEEGFGSGDKWLLGSLGIWFGYFDIIFIFFHSCIFATAYIFIFKLYKKNLTQKIPIGTFFCLTSITYLFL